MPTLLLRYRRIVIVGWLLLGASVWNVPAGMAQASVTPTARSDAPSKLVDPRLPTESDTGRMQRGWGDYSRYQTPGQCLAAVRDLDQVAKAWVAPTMDTMPYPLNRIRDTITTVAREEARQCVEHLGKAEVPSREWLNMVRLTLLTGDDAGAWAMIDRRLLTAADDAARVRILNEVFDVYWNTNPRRIAAAERIATRVDSLGAAAVPVRAKLHRLLLVHATTAFDRDAMHRGIDAIAAIVARGPDSDYESLPLEVKFAADQVDEALKQLLVYEHPLPEVLEVHTAFAREKLYGPTVPRFGVPLDSGFVHRFGYPFIGAPLPPLQANYWTPAGDSPYPRRGRVSLVLPAGGGVLGGDDRPIREEGSDFTRSLQTNVGTSAARLAMLRRLHEKYGAYGLDIIMMRRPTGFTPPDSLAARYEQTQAWFAKEAGFPIILGLEDRPFSVLPPPDGRRVYRKTSYEETFGTVRSLLVDQEGVVVATPETEAQIDAFVRKALNLDGR